MPLDLVHSDNPDHHAAAEAPSPYGDFGLQATWGETAVTVVATSLALLIVATVAILMGMA